MGPLCADMTLGLYQKFLALVVHQKIVYPTRNHIKKAKRYNLTAGIMDILMAKPTDYANTKKANIMTDKVVKDVLQQTIEEKK